MTHELWDTLELANGCSWAVLQAGDRQTRYLRVGKGTPVVLLPSQVRSAEFWTSVTDHLSERHRVMMPDFPWHPSVFGEWFRSFLDGLGVPAVSLVVAEEFALAALECALLEPEMVNHVVVIPDQGPDQGALEGHLSATHNLAQIPVLILRPGASDRDAVVLLRAFLSSPRP